MTFTPAPRWIDLDDQTRTSLRDLAEPPWIVPPDLTCDELDRELRARWSITSVLVRDPQDPERLGVIVRDEFMATMTGQHGYGRALWSRRAVAELTSWRPRLISEHAGLTDAASMLTGGTRKEYHQDLVVVDGTGEPIGILRPTTVMEALADRFAEHASRDQLTGLASRASFVASLDRMCRVARSGRYAVALGFIDLDRLKEVNDTLGHAAGDDLLRDVATRLAACLRTDELLGRLGGDEFAVASLTDHGGGDGERTVVDRAAELGDRILAAITEDDGVAGRAVDPAGHPLPVTDPVHRRASIGVAVAEHAPERVSLLRQADLAMYGAKKAGGNRVVVTAVRAADGRGRVAEQRPHGFVLGIGGDGAQQVLPVEGRLEVVYQPIVTAADGEPRSVEALLRHRPGPGLEVRGPVEVLATAAQHDLSLELDLWVLGQACRDMVAWERSADAAAPTFLDVNLGPGSVGAPALAERVMTVVARSGLPLERLRLELPETSTLEELLQAGPQLAVLRAAGVQLALDDFGSALTSVRHVTELDVDGLKVDRWLVDGLLAEPACEALVRVMVDLARARGIAVTAEGVETADQLTALRGLGVDDVQGFHIARPMVADEVAAWLSTAGETVVTGASADRWTSGTGTAS